MYLPAPNLDDRHFQDLVDEAKRSIPRFCPRWTDHNVSDPGVTLIELFAWMTEQYLFRLNQVPDKNFVTFLDLIGVRLQPARPARGDVTFTLAAAPTATRRALIPAWTEVATERTAAEEAVVFTTDADAEVFPSTLRWLLTTTDGFTFQDRSSSGSDDRVFDVWSSPPRPADALYLGFDEDLSAHTLVLRLNGERVALGIDPVHPPWVWEVWRGAELGWESISVTSDTTAGLHDAGELVFHLPFRCQSSRISLREARTWIRCSPADRLEPGQAPYARSPRVRVASTYTIGITVPVTHATLVRGEVLGTSNGQPGQRFRFLRPNVLRLEGPDEVVEVEAEDGGWEAWHAVPDFGDSGPTDKHYVVDAVSGQIELGPVVRQTDGTEPQFGAVPPRGRRLRARQYRVGGGVRGNVAEGRVKVLKTTIPYVREVTNRFPLTGGEEPQTLEDAKLRGPKRLRTRFRAVTSDDFEYLAGEVEGIGRVRCLQPRSDEPDAPPPGTVRLLVIPTLPKLEGAELERHVALHEALPQLGPDDRARAVADLQRLLTLPGSTRERLRAYLDERRLLTTRLEIREPQYIWVTVQTRIKPNPKMEPDRVRRDVKAELYRYLHPRYGGPDGEGWPFGQPLTIDKVYALIQKVRGVEYATELKLFPVDLSQGQLLGASEQVIEVPANAVIASYYHNVRVD